ncbi:MAG TPA: glutathione S-transferase N-terminal domain-containing protein [Victivallales bacterium]|nr:glutathione S-transferase N-terminal domain-containing protein [Victivallales bacterium]
MKLELYYFESCPFCQKVLLYLEDKKHDIIFLDTKVHKEYRENLLKMNKNTQVPCLVIDGEPILESDEIILFLEQNKSKWTKE